MTYISIIERKGIEQGYWAKRLKQGIEQGIGQGRAATLYKLLQLKFNEQAREYEQRLFQANDAELNLWTERVLFAESIDAVFAK